MNVIEGLLTKVATALESGTVGTGWLPPGRKYQSFDQAFARQPGSVMQVLLFRGEDLVYHQLYDPAGRNVFSDPANQGTVVRTVMDFMRDTFGGRGSCVAYTCGKWKVVGLVEGTYTLVALAPAAVDSGKISRWLENLAHRLPVGVA